MGSALISPEAEYEGWKVFGPEDCGWVMNEGNIQGGEFPILEEFDDCWAAGDSRAIFKRDQLLWTRTITSGKLTGLHDTRAVSKRSLNILWMVLLCYSKLFLIFHPCEHVFQDLQDFLGLFR